jgi:hypothetical protein
VVLGARDGETDGASLGVIVGDPDGESVVGNHVGEAVGVVVGACVGIQTSQTYRRRWLQALLSNEKIPLSAVMLADVVPC